MMLRVQFRLVSCHPPALRASMITTTLIFISHRRAYINNHTEYWPDSCAWLTLQYDLWVHQLYWWMMICACFCCLSRRCLHNYSYFSHLVPGPFIELQLQIYNAVHKGYMGLRLTIKLKTFLIQMQYNLQN